MEYYKLCDSDYKFMMIIWEAEPVNSGELVRRCDAEFGWKKSTTYTEIKRLTEKGYIKNENAIVTSLVSREQVQADESEYFVERTFGGSLPSFLTAFLGNKTISEKDARMLKKLIDEHKE